MSGTLTRKQREIKEREAKILELARGMIVQDGYHGLSMDRIAEALEYSKGTIYQHFSCKEEILMALVNQAMERRLELFRRAAAFRGRSRERMSAIGAACDLFFRLYPDDVHIEHAIRITSIKEKASEQRRLCLERCEASCSELVRGVIYDAVAAGDLELDDDFSVEQLTFGLWSITFGGHSIAASSPSLTNLGIPDPMTAIRNNCNRLLDGSGWKPLSHELDLDTLIGRIQREVFAPEVAQLSQQGQAAAQETGAGRARRD
ncbi:MAG TPA: TetR/AcrR family transcriptional regulator [Pirellulales bacterium]|nr:TetR/AcrR family transcriptional regulator [Pirellulales bacterium]